MRAHGVYAACVRCVPCYGARGVSDAAYRSIKPTRETARRAMRVMPLVHDAMHAAAVPTLSSSFSYTPMPLLLSPPCHSSPCHYLPPARRYADMLAISPDARPLAPLLLPRREQRTRALMPRSDR